MGSTFARAHANVGAIHEWADFVHPLIGVNPDLKFSVEYDHKFVSFLDMWAE